MDKLELQAGEELEITIQGRRVRVVVPTQSMTESDDCCAEGCELLYYHYVGTVRFAVCDCGTHTQTTLCPE